MFVKTNFVSSCNLQLTVTVEFLGYSRELTAEIANLFFTILTYNQPQPYSASFFLEEVDKAIAYMPPKYTHPK